MGVEVVSVMAQVPVETVTDGGNTFIHENGNGKLSQGPNVNEPIKFGSDTTDEEIKGQGNGVFQSNLPKDAVDEWPEPKQIHNFYFVRNRPYDDPQLKAKLDLADKEIQKKNQARSQITEALKAKRSDRAELISRLKSLTAENKQFRMVADEKRKEMGPLQEALGKLRGSNNSGRERGFGLCSSEEELDGLIESLNYRIQHESIPLKEEKQIIREINQLQGTREEVIANAALRAKIQESLGQREDIQDQVKLMGHDLGGVKKERQALISKIKSLEEELRAIDNDIKSLQVELELVTQKQDTAYEGLRELRKQRDGGNAYFYQNRSLLNKARELAAKKDLTSLEELSHAEMETFMSQWSSNKAFRDDYEKRILRSLDSREMSKDGRIRNPNEKPLMAVEAPAALEKEKTPKVKQPKEDVKSLPKQDSSDQKGDKEVSNEVRTDSKTNGDHDEKESKEKSSVLENALKESSRDMKVDPARLKQMKREEEIAKAKLASERKKKLVNKATAKAAVRAQKEAEKRLKEREKKAKKKAAASANANNPDEVTIPAEEVAQPEKVSDDNGTPVRPQNKDRKENSIVRNRRGQRIQDSRPKVILKRKKLTNYWVWAAPASFFVVLLLVFGYQYLL